MWPACMSWTNRRLPSDGVAVTPDAVSAGGIIAGDILPAVAGVIGTYWLYGSLDNRKPGGRADERYLQRKAMPPVKDDELRLWK